MQNILSGVTPSGTPNGNQLLTLGEPGNLLNIRPITSNSTLSSISSKNSTKQSVNCSVDSPLPGQNNTGSAGDSQVNEIRSPSPHSLPSVHNQQAHNISSSSSSESGVRIYFIFRNPLELFNLEKSLTKNFLQ